MKKLLQKYFEGITPTQINQMQKFAALLLEQNEKHNLISRADTDNIFVHHILHSLAIAKFIQFKTDTKILDLGTGGGLPGIPLAILFGDCRFTLCDSILKKINSVALMVEALNLKNVQCICERAENLNEKFEFVVTRAVAKTQKLKTWSNHLLLDKNKNSKENGIIALKGGNLNEELKKFKKKVVFQNISTYFDDPFFETKMIIYLKC